MTAAMRIVTAFHGRANEREIAGERGCESERKGRHTAGTSNLVLAAIINCCVLHFSQNNNMSN